MRTNFDIVIDYKDLVGHDYQCSWRIRNREPISGSIERLRLSSLGYWFHNKFTGECVRTVSTTYKLNQMQHKLDQQRIPVKQVRALKNM